MFGQEAVVRSVEGSSHVAVGMPAELVSDGGKHMVIRPLAYVKEVTERYAEVKQFPIIPCDLRGSQENLQRKQIKAMIREWEKKFPEPCSTPTENTISLQRL